MIQFQSGETLYNLQELIDCLDLSTLKTNSCQVNFDWLQTFNQKFIEKKLSEPDSARRLLEDAKIGDNFFLHTNFHYLEFNLKILKLFVA